MKRALGYLLLSAGLFLASSDIFLAMWTWAAHGEPDIIARGSILLGLLSPYFAAAVACLTVATAVLTAMRQREHPVQLALIAVAAVGLTYSALYLDRTLTVWHLLGTSRLSLGSPGYTVLEALLLVSGGYFSVSRLRRPRHLDPAV